MHGDRISVRQCLPGNSDIGGRHTSVAMTTGRVTIATREIQLKIAIRPGADSPSLDGSFDRGGGSGSRGLGTQRVHTPGSERRLVVCVQIAVVTRLEADADAL